MTDRWFWEHWSEAQFQTFSPKEVEKFLRSVADTENYDDLTPGEKRLFEFCIRTHANWAKHRLGER